MINFLTRLLRLLFLLIFIPIFMNNHRIRIMNDHGPLIIIRFIAGLIGRRGVFVLDHRAGVVHLLDVVGG